MTSVAHPHLDAYEAGIAAAREQFLGRLLPLFDAKDPRVVAAGTGALGAYARCLEDCMAMTKQYLAQA